MELIEYKDLIGMALVVMAVILLIAILFILTQYNTLRAIQPLNRSLSPWEVSLQLIPLFGLVWQFIVVKRISDSIMKELTAAPAFSFDPSNDTSLPDTKPTYQIGMGYCILLSLGLVPIPLIQTLFSLAGIVCWIIYWVKLSGYRKQIAFSSFSV